MQSPAVMFIESAIDMLKDVPEFIANSQVNELKSLGDARARRVGASGVTDDFTAGYVLGLQTARVIIMSSVEIRIKGVNPDDVL
jgi:hypothetical protein